MKLVFLIPMYLLQPLSFFFLLLNSLHMSLPNFFIVIFHSHLCQLGIPLNLLLAISLLHHLMVVQVAFNFNRMNHLLLLFGSGLQTI